MRKYMFILIVCLLLMSSHCGNKNDHFYITIQNLSDNDIDLALPAFLPSYDTCSACSLSLLHTLEKHSVFEWRPFIRYGIEQGLSGRNPVLELYFVNNRQALGFYDCDSIFIKNDVLEYYKLTLEDLQRMNWTVVYAPGAE